MKDFFGSLRGELNSKVGIVASVGKVWSEQRRFALHKLKDLGFGRNSMEGLIINEAIELSNYIKDQIKTRDTFSLDGKIDLFIFNALMNIMSSKRLDINSQKDGEIFKKLVKCISIASISNGWDRISIFIYQNTGYKSQRIKDLQADFQFLRDLFDSYYDEHEATLDEDSPRDFIDFFIMEINRATANNETDSSFYGNTGKINYFSTLFDLFLAGSDTTNSSIRHILVYLMNYPDAQKKVQEELDQVVGKSRLLTMANKDDLPYLNAFIHEVMRCTNVGLTTLPRTNREPAKIQGYHIPKGTTVYGSLSAINTDPKYVKNPDVFDPEQFIDETTGKFKPNPAVLPFGIGRRQCIGINLAKMELYLFTGALIQQFNFKLVPTAPADVNNCIIAPSRTPRPFRMKVEVRNVNEY